MAKLRLVTLGLVVGALLAVGLAFGVTEASAAGTNSTGPKAEAAPTQPTPAGFVGISPVRVLDTRVPTGVATKGPLGPGATINVAIAGVGGVPADATAVTINITSVNATAPSYFTVYPTGSSRPLSSVANVNPGLSMESAGSFDLGTGGELTVFNASGSANAVMDVTGYYVVVPAPPPGPVTYNWSGTVTPIDPSVPSELDGSTVIPAGSSVTPSSSSTISGDFTSCTDPIVDFFSADAGPPVEIAVWTPSGNVSVLTTTDLSTRTFNATGPVSMTAFCLSGTTPTVSFNITFTVTPPVTPYS